MERCALALDALDPHGAAHQLGEAFADGEAQARAAVLAGGRGVELAELLEQLVGTIGRDADASVANREMDLVGCVARIDGHDDLADLGELHGVGEQVDHHLAQAGDVARDAVGDRRIDQERQLQRLAGGGFGDEVERRLDASPQIERRDFQLEATGVDLREVEDVVDDPEQRLAAGADDLGELPLAGLQVGVEQQPAHADHGVHRRADLVAHGGEERPLGLVGLLCEPGLLLQPGEQVGVRDRDYRLLGERLQDASMAGFERADLLPAGVELSVVPTLDHQGGHDEAPRLSVLVALRDGVVVLDEHGCGEIDVGDVVSTSDLAQVPSTGRRHHQIVAVTHQDRSAIGVAQSDRLLDDAGEDGVEVTRIGADQLQDLGRGGLQLQRFGEVVVALLDLAEQASVLDGDRRLIGEGFQERDLVVGVPTGGRTGETDRADDLAAALHRHRQGTGAHPASG